MNEPFEEGMYIIPTTCYKCKKPMNMAIISRGDNAFFGPESFSEEEKDIAKYHDVIVQNHYSGMRKESYNAATCPHCSAFIGLHFIFTEYISPVIYGDCEFKIIHLK